MRKIQYIILGGSIDGYRYGAGVATSKEKAARICRRQGYRWSSRDQRFFNKTKDRWLRVERVHVDRLHEPHERVSYGRS